MSRHDKEKEKRLSPNDPLIFHQNMQFVENLAKKLGRDGEKEVLKHYCPRCGKFFDL